MPGISHLCRGFQNVVLLNLAIFNGPNLPKAKTHHSHRVQASGKFRR
jgi:hypothetical protein